MSTEQWSVVDSFICDAFVPRDAALDAALEASARAGLPAINVAPNQGKLLNLLARIQGARRILEVGTLGGYSTIWLARALPPDGSLTTLEINPDYANVARENIARAGLAQQVTVRLGDAVQTLRELAREGAAPFDFVFLDAKKEYFPQYLDGALALARPGTVIVCDNVVRGGRVVDAHSNDADVQGVRRYYELAGAHPRLTSTAVQTVGSKGWDGFAVSIVQP
ncbi:O-methyltransferase [Trinickia caryophylli]|uniref:Predicted O-methyltransferase YrrM n=1 Tax=Trinickia caryophylli TaxID=28094 RepID=A0A1X7E1A6_TRICW|nr:O-methyltransferase [Trinickia caryophylli]PMS14094.1 O-methyltransferase [Trinickia caryophylli]TRX17793.1 O-methyltransferase [Trinickia caryophylli]WQE11440.1 O-methyltransferase [Trinickia caryophylli]SMF24945.1 Predicted O-methyltransferase YrrM [Trinickia caryophylli]GLU32604.1 O-methyltransferase [Trinickia caryophylli]